MVKGIEFIFKDDTKDRYDPVNIDTEFIITKKSYIINTIHRYEISKDRVKEFSFYDVCEYCGHQLFENLCCLNSRCISFQADLLKTKLK
jgi:hypothetical protein